MNTFTRVNASALKTFASLVLAKTGMSESDCRAVADVLVTADLRGNPSHGVAHLRRHLADLKAGLTKPDVKPQIIRETPATAVIDAGHAAGAPTSIMAMDKAMDKAMACGIGAVAVRHSSHHGISGYYAARALASDMIGMALTNTAALGAPTFGLEPRFGTNPIAFAAPALTEAPFILDMSTTVVTRGSIEICSRLGLEPPVGWAVNAHGAPPLDAAKFLDELLAMKGGILPLGGQGTKHGGHKGYGLAVMVDILCSLLSGGDFGINVRDTKETAASVNHFFWAIDIKAFRDPLEFKTEMDELLTLLKTTKPVTGVERVVYAGLTAHELERDALKNGAPIIDEVYSELLAIAREWGIPAPEPLL